MNPRASADRLADDTGGSAAVEFAIVAPLFFMLLFGIIQLGWAYHCASSVQYALEHASRAVMLDADTDADDVREAMAAFLQDVARDDFDLTLEDVEINGTDFARMTATYDHEVDVPLLTPFTLHFSSVQIAPRPEG